MKKDNLGKISILLIISLFCIVSLNSVNAIDNSTAGGGIKTAISSASHGDSIYLDEGIYRGTNNTGLIIDKNINIIGNGSTKNVVIDAQNLRRIFTISSGINVTFINITFFKSNTSGNGGAIFNNYASTSITIINSEFINNYAYNGGAMYTIGKNIDIIDCNFTNNTAGRVNYAVGGNGGAIYINSTSTILTINNSQFTNNIANQSAGLVAGAIYSIGILNINNSNFTNNTARGSGAAIYSTGSRSNITIINSNFIENKCYNHGGGAIATSTISKGSNMTIINSTFINNTGPRGGAISISYHDTIIIGSNFINNSVNEYGGAIYSSGGQIVNISNSNFTNNIANEGGAIYNAGINLSVSDCNFINNIATNGGAICNVNIINYVDNSIFTTNNATNGGAIYNSGRNMSLTDSIFTNNKASISGGAIYNGVASQFDLGNMIISGNTMNGNIAGLGNAIFNNGNMSVLNLTYLNNSTIYVTNGKTILLFANLTDDRGNKITGQNISFYINGVFIGNVTVIEGEANLTYKVNQRSGVSTVSGDYAGHKNMSIDLNNAQLIVSTSANITGNINNDKNEYAVNDSAKGTIIITNNGPDMAENVSVEITLPFYFVLDGRNVVVSHGSFDSNTGIWYIGDLDSGEKATMTFVGQFTDIGTNMFSIYVYGDNFNSTSDENTVLVKTIPPNSTPVPNPTLNETNKTNYTDKSSANPTVNAAVMKETGIPIITILLVLLSSLGLIVKRK